MPTDFSALDALYPLPPEELPRQWLLTRDPAALPAEWERRTIEGWNFAAHPDAHVCDLRASDGTSVGWLVEPLAYLTAVGDSLPGSELTLPVSAHASPADIERALYGRDESGRSNGDGVQGMWVAIVFGGAANAPFRRIYLGPIHSVVYNETHRAVATSHNLFSGLRRDDALSRAFDPLATDAYFTFGLTAFESLRRLLPNHYLDLDTFQPVRHWPLQALEPLVDGKDGAAAIVKHARRLVTVLATRHRSFRVFLSAGQDSRAILALLRPLIDEGTIDVVLTTTVGRDFESRMDVQAARRLVRIASLPHEVRRRRPHNSEAADVVRAFVRIGESKAGHILSAAANKEKQRLRDDRFNLAGMAGEVGRASWGGGSDSSIHEVTPEILAKRTSSPNTELVSTAAGAWLHGLPQGVRASPLDTLDFAYLEQRMGCWESPVRYLFPGLPGHRGRTSTSPMAMTAAIETMLRLPKDYRTAGVLQRDMVAYGWPELLEVPFNTPSGWLRLRWGVSNARLRLFGG